MLDYKRVGRAVGIFLLLLAVFIALDASLGAEPTIALFAMAAFAKTAFDFGFGSWKGAFPGATVVDRAGLALFAAVCVSSLVVGLWNALGIIAAFASYLVWSTFAFAVRWKRLRTGSVVPLPGILALLDQMWFGESSDRFPLP